MGGNLEKFPRAKSAGRIRRCRNKAQSVDEAGKVFVKSFPGKGKGFCQRAGNVFVLLARGAGEGGDLINVLVKILLFIWCRK